MPAPPLLEGGAQAERTALAWQRTGFALLGAGAVLLHVGGEAGLLLPVVGLLDLVAGAGVGALVAPLRYRRTLDAVAGARSPVAHRSPLAVTACVVATGLVAGANLITTL